MAQHDGVVETTDQTLALETDLTASQVATLRPQIKGLVAAGMRRLVVDMARCGIVDSSGIGLLVATHNSLVRMGGSLSLTGVSKDLRDLFETMRLQQHFTIA